ncbi:MAG: redoxin domain-containing protein [Blastocatellia bacterium]
MKKAICGSLGLLLIFAVAFVAIAQEKPDAKAQELLDKGKRLISQGQFDEAVVALDEAIKLKPEMAALYQQLGRAYANKFFSKRDAQLETKARVALNRALELDSSLAEAYFTLGRIDAFNRNYKNARTDYERAIKADPTLVKAYGEKWRTMLKRPDFEVEIPIIRAEIENLLKRTDNRLSVLAAATLGFEIIGDEKSLIDTQNRLLSEFPNDERADGIQLDRIYQEKDQRQQIEMSEAYLARNPESQATGTLRQMIFLNRLAQGNVSDDELTRIGEALIKSVSGDVNSMVLAYPQVIIAFSERRLALEHAKEWADEDIRMFDGLKPDSPLMDKYPPTIRDEMIQYGKSQAHKARGYLLIKLGKTEEASKELKTEFEPVIKAVEKDGYVFWKDMDLRSLGARPRVLWLAEIYELEGDYQRAAKYLLAGFGDDEQANRFILERLPVVYKKLGRSEGEATTALNASKSRYLSMKDSSVANDEEVKNSLLAKRLKTPAPEFKAMKLDKKIMGLSDFKGKVAVVNFWATWCGPCIAEMPYFQKVVDRYKNQSDVVFIAISIDKDKPVVRPFLEKNRYTIPAAYDDNAADAFKVEGVPTTFIIDRNGVIQFSDFGFGEDEHYIDRLVWRIDALLKDTSAASSPGPIKERKKD